MSSIYNIVQTYVAAEAITSEFTLVSLDANGKVTITDAATEEACVGVAQRACALGDAVDVVVFGLTRVIASETITFATTPRLAADANGRVQASEPGDATFYPIGRAMANINQTSAAAGEQFTCLFVGPVSLV